MTRVLVTGARGLLGAAIAREFARPGSEVYPFGRTDLDITNRDAVDRAVEEIRPTLIVNCAAFNDVDGAEDDAAAALAVNSLGVLALARAAERVSAAFVHYSTDFVFDGETTRPYTEEDEPRPRSNYGMSKLLGEWLALERSTSGGRPTPNVQHPAPSAQRPAPKTWVLRVESLFGDASPGRAEKGSVHAIISRIRQRAAVPVFVDRTVSPTYTRDVTQATRAIVASNAPAGLYHGVNSGFASWADIAQEIGKILGLPVQLEKVTLESANLKASRPRYCALSNAKLASVGISMPSWQDALGRHLSNSR